MYCRYTEDIARLSTDKRIDWSLFNGASVVITGATGLLGGLLTRTLIERNRVADACIRIMIPVRNVQKAQELFGDTPDLQVIAWDASSKKVPDISACDYIVHCASNTNSMLMVERPVDTINTIVAGTQAMLDLAQVHDARMCFVSSMEVYGRGADDVLDENRGGELNTMDVRNSYPQAKQLAETLCAAHAKQYGVKACVARLAQSFGPGVDSGDRRVFAEFSRCCLEGRNIVLLTDGSKSNMYVYTADAVRALLTLVTRGEPGLAYNVANESTFCSIYQMAQLVAREFGPSTQVTKSIDAVAAKRYAVSGSIRMDVSRLRALGWEPDYGLTDMYRRMIEDWGQTD